LTRKSLLLLAVVLGACRPVGQAPMHIAVELAPTGQLRAAINFGNPVLAQKDPATGEARGVSVDLARELSWRLAVPLDIVPYDAAGKVTADATKNKWDVAFFAVDPQRAEDVAFSAPYVIIEGIEQVMATPKDRERSIEYLRKFVEEQKANGFVAAALARSGRKDAIVAPPAK
jgi:polar amino acid transport system substrate-binding protein